MESLTSFINSKRKQKKRRSAEYKNGPVIHIAQSIDREPKPIRRKKLEIPHREFHVGYYTPIEVEYEGKNGIPRVYIEPEFKDLPIDIQKREQRRTRGMSKITDMEILYELYGK